MEINQIMSLQNDDSFDDDDDFDIDQVYSNVQSTQIPFDTNKRKSSIMKSSIKKQHEQSNTDDIYQIKGENSILRGQLDKLHKEQQEEHNRMREEFNKLLKDKESYIQALNENILKVKSENEFLVSENKNLYQSNSRKRKLRSVDPVVSDTSIDSTNIQSQLHSQPEFVSAKGKSVQNENGVNKNSDMKVYIMNQATFFQDEKTLFIEAITNYIIPGLPKPTLNYLESISSTMDFSTKGFQINKNENSFKSSILKFLIDFQDKNRIDKLLANFIEILLDYIICCVHDRHPHLLPVPFLVSLINFSLNYRPKAIDEDLIYLTTQKIIPMLAEFQALFKPEFDYLALPSSNHMFAYMTLQQKDDNDLMDYNFLEKTMHVKILEVFSAIFLMDTLSTLSKISSFHAFTFSKSFSNRFFWSEIPQQMLINSFLSRKTPIHFIYNTIEILINSIDDDDKFAFDHKNNNSITNPKIANDITIKILEQAMQFLNTLSPSQIHFNIYGLNYLIGSNSHHKLLELVSIPSGELSSFPRTNSLDTYESILKTNFETFKDQEFYTLNVKFLILNLFELFYSVLIMILLPLNTNLKLIKNLCQLIGEEQEMIIRSPRSTNNNLRIEIISKSIKIIHHLIAQEGSVKINELPNLTLREMIIVLIRISSRSMKNYSIDFVTKLRRDNYNGILFDEDMEREELDKFGFWNSILSIDKLTTEEKAKLIEDRIQIETDLYNGIEFNYSDETIDLARDIVGLSVTGDEADRLHDSINYVNDNNDGVDYDIDLGDF